MYALISKKKMQLVRLLLLRLAPALPAATLSSHTTPPCLLDATHDSSWVSGSVGRHLRHAPPECSVLLQGLRAGRWEALVFFFEADFFFCGECSLLLQGLRAGRWEYEDVC